ncbi:unnamed protein product [Heligmosomoides polygyrus]|uniref:Metalloendopeptidase n=1 Tax=Heligmosomoides polygyrus TaxID=6339 RepID=A0A183G375_HELPZ|nr:unnamed protein product [Heligmosomoides polygyrus]
MEVDKKLVFQRHFGVEESGLDSVEDVLLKLKKLAHQRAFGNREFGHDAEEDSKKPVSISTLQPIVAKELSPYLFEGDIFLSKKQAISILKEVSGMMSAKGSRGRRSFDADPKSKWSTRAPIKYRFHESLDFYAISNIIKAIRYWENVTCLEFENSPDVSEDEDYIEFFQGQGCYSMIGRNGGRQGISIGENCVKAGVIEHEIGHAIGMWHQQSRPDAQSYIKARPSHCVRAQQNQQRRSQRKASAWGLPRSAEQSRVQCPALNSHVLLQVQSDFILPSYVSDFLQRDKDIDTLGLPYDLGSAQVPLFERREDCSIHFLKETKRR